MVWGATVDERTMLDLYGLVSDVLIDSMFVEAKPNIQYSGRFFKRLL